MDELITVIINVYNAEKYVSKCIESIINQTYKNLEILIVNDGSTDNTLELCKSYQDKRIKIINQENMGLSKSRNVGIENANGKYLYFVDSDDYVEKDVIEYLYKLCKEYNVPVSTCRPIDVYDYDTTIKNKKEKVEVILSKEMLKKVLLSTDRAGTTWNKLMKRELFDTIRFEDRIINDVVVTYKIVLEAKKIVYSNQIKYYYFRHSDSILGRKRPEHSMDLYKACVERYNYIKNRYPKFIENEIGLNLIIMSLYLHDNPIVQKFLIEQRALEQYKKLFSFKLLLCKLRFREKIKLILFRINPKLCLFLVRNYLKMKK